MAIPQKSPGLSDTEKARVFEQLRSDLTNIHARWQTVKEMWYPTVDHLRAHEKYGNDFFAMLQRSVIDDLMIALARFTDVDKEGKCRSVTLATAVDAVQGRQGMAEAKLRLGSVWPKIKDVRDRVLAHRDFDLHIPQKAAKPLAGITFGEIRTFVEEVTAIMRTIDMAYDGTNLLYETPVRFGSWDGIMHGLARAERLESLGHRVAAGAPVNATDFLLPVPPRRSL